MTDMDDWRRVSFVEARRSKPPTPDFCLPNLLAGSVGVVAAPAGIGKTSLLMQLGAAVAAGMPVAGNLLPAPATTGRVVFLATEDPPAIMQRRAHFLIRSLEAQQDDTGVAERLERNFVFYSLSRNVPTLLTKSALGEHGLNRVTGLARDTRLLILDPIRRFHYCDERDYDHMSTLFGLLSNIAATTGCTILFSHHVAQPTTQANLDEPAGVLGSDAFVNATRWVLNMTGMSRDEAQRFGINGDRRRYVRASFTKSNYGPPIPARWLQRSEQFEGVFETCELDQRGSGSE